MPTETLRLLSFQPGKPKEYLVELTYPYLLWPRHDDFWFRFAPQTYELIHTVLQEFIHNRISESLWLHIIIEPINQHADTLEESFKTEGEISFRFKPNSEEAEVGIQFDGWAWDKYSNAYHKEVGDTYYFERKDFKTKEGAYDDQSIEELLVEVFSTIASYEEKLVGALGFDLDDLYEWAAPFPEHLRPIKF